ncbi:3-oxoacyl-(acyl-carrier-protein) reductase [Thalassoporum mexicanum PCC 7367]|uniref:SDR family oxidoreductase n=1 Tax=Thalassoporum mexicanum TaxID=3457544 RepID=UPI00029FC721|nr:SDR family oxidoreductase [Pseudanabaena sp. PCC 7367]AFY69914.1 3-oxoacyl-(acyl-carrier-protein) reductase [Pseudanabaena sp. PCC 7367]
MNKLANKTAVITGGTSGIGFETAKYFIAEGARVIITGRKEDTLKEAAQQLGEKAIPVKADVRSLADLDQLANQVKEHFGSLDIIFANAGVGYFTPLEAANEASYDNEFDINVKGVFFTVQKLVGLLNSGASIILNASAVNAKGMAMGSLYFAAKAAVRSFARSFAAELGSKNIRVNSLSPGIVRTNFEKKLDLPDGAFEGFINTVVNSAPLGRAGKVEEIAKAATFLASDDSSYMTATDMVVDGGWMNV